MNQIASEQVKLVSYWTNLNIKIPDLSVFQIQLSHLGITQPKPCVCSKSDECFRIVDKKVVEEKLQKRSDH